MSTYLDLVEEHKSQSSLNQFEKVLVLSERAKDLYTGKTCLVDSAEGRKPTTKAQLEFSQHKIEPAPAPERPKKSIEDDEEFED